MSNVFGIVFFGALLLCGASVFKLDDPSIVRLGLSFIAMFTGMIGVVVFALKSARES